MSQFTAHVSPAFSLVLFGLIRLIHTLHHMIKHKSLNYSISRYQLNSAYVINTARFKYPIPFESIFKILFAGLGIMVELIEWHFEYVQQEFHHISIISTFLISGIVDLLRMKLKVPRKFDYMIFSLAFGVEAFIFNNHVFHRPLVDAFLHKLLIYGATLTSIITMLLLFIDNYYIHMNLRLFQSILILLNGSWFWQISFTLFTPQFRVHNLFSHEAVMKLAMIYSWHFIIIIFSVVLLYIIMDQLITSTNESAIDLKYKK